MKGKYTAIHKLHEKLTELGIPHTMQEVFGGWQIAVPENHRPNEFEGDAIQHPYSYGNQVDKIEVYGFGLDEPAGYLKADEALKYFVEWYEKQKAGDLDK